MPLPRTPPFVQAILDIQTELAAQTAALAALQVAVAAQKDDIEKIANFQRWQLESFYGAGTDITGMWDGTDRY